LKNIFGKTNTENSTLHRPAKLYADLLEKQYGRRPVVFAYTTIPRGTIIITA